MQWGNKMGILLDALSEKSLVDVLYGMVDDLIYVAMGVMIMIVLIIIFFKNNKR